MIKAASITIGFSEHPDHQHPKSFSGENCWADAQSYLNSLVAAIPEDLLGYYKTDFSIQWEDDKEYEGRLDLKHPNSSNSDHHLPFHVRQFCLTHSGRHCPYWMSADQYQQVLRYVSAEQRDYFADLLDNYDLTFAACPVTIAT